MKSLIFVLLFHFSALCYQVFGDIKSLGPIRFDVGNDQTVDATLNSVGLGLGVSIPSANLEVNGNILSETISIGETTASANLNLSGTVSQLSTVVSDNGMLPNSSLVMVDTSQGNISLQLPNTEGKISERYLIKKTSSDYSLYLWGGWVDQVTELSFGPNTGLYPFVELVSGSGNQWYVTDVMGQSAMIDTSSLVTWFPFNESSGNTLMDLSAAELSGIATNFSSSNIGISGQIDKAIDFDGEDDQVVVADHASLDSPTTELTVCFWVKDEDESANSGYISKEINSGAGWGIEDARFFIWGSTDSSSHIYDDIDDDQWHHMAYTWDGTDSNVYRDGVLLDSLTDGGGTITTNNDPLTIGYTKLSANNERYFKGKMDDVRIYSSTLTADQIHVIYAANR